MKAGLVTFYHIHHYGALLQAAATERAVERFGWDCEIIDYFVNQDNALFKRPTGLGSAAHDAHTALHYQALSKRYRRFEKFSRDHLRISDRRYGRFDELAERINAHTQAVLINTPNNPSGVVYTRETLEKLAQLLTEKSREVGHPVYLISDEPYRELVYDGAVVSWVPSIYPNTVVCYSYSKSLSLPGERIGYVCVPDSAEDSAQLFAAVAGAARVLGHVCPPSLQQRVVARCAAERPDLEAYDKNRRALYEALTGFGYVCPKANGAFYMFVKAPGGSSKAFSDRAKEKNVLVVPGNDFGCPEYFRLCTCVSYDTIQRSLPLFKELIESYR